MRALFLFLSVSLSYAGAFGQATVPAFEVASVKPCQHLVGPDYNNQITTSATGFTARSATLKRLIAEAYHLQLDQVQGPGWLDRDEFDIDARTAGGTPREQMALMLRSLLAERFNLTKHTEMREMRVYELVAGKTGARIHAVSDGDAVKPQPGFHFHGDMRQFADLLALQFSIPAAGDPSQPSRAGGPQIPVVDKTALAGIFDFSVDMRPEPGTDMFTAWQRALEDQLGLRIESRKENVDVMIVDGAARMPSAN